MNIEHYPTEVSDIEWKIGNPMMQWWYRMKHQDIHRCIAVLPHYEFNDTEFNIKENNDVLMILNETLQGYNN